MDVITKEALQNKVPRGAEQKEDFELCHCLGHTKVQHDLRGHGRMLGQTGGWGIGGLDQLDNVVHAHNSLPPCRSACLLGISNNKREEKGNVREKIRKRLKRK